MDPNKVSECFDKFQHYFPGNSEAIRRFFAPGRVNLIGEHTDYNNGYVFPAGLTMGTYLCIRLREDGQIHMRSANFDDQLVSFSVESLDFDPKDDWGNYPKGIIKEILILGSSFKGADFYYIGDLPNGAGLSSSASIGMVTAYALSQLTNINQSIEELALLCQRMENNFIGVKTGIMDQFAVGFAKANHALFLNCGTLERELVPLELGNYCLVMTHTNKRRGLADSKYNERRLECETALGEFRKLNPELGSLSDLDLEMFESYAEQLQLPELIKKRARHVVTENHRVLQAVNVLKANDLKAFGQLMVASHESLRDDYEVTGKELDALFSIQKEAEGCLGSRMTGAGFGGCTVSLVKADQIEDFKEKVAKEYEAQTGLEPLFYVSEAGNGVSEIK